MAKGPSKKSGSIGQKWVDLGAEKSFLGYPISDEEDAPDGVSRISHFQHGSIYWSSHIGVIVVNK